MAVSKTQNERPAIVALIDAVNMAEPIVAHNVQNIATLTDGLTDEVNNRDAADALLRESVQAEADARTQAVQAEADARTQAVQAEADARTQAVHGVQNQIENINEAIDNINHWQGRFRLGLSANVTVAAGSSTTGTLAFGTPFGEDTEVAVFPVCVDSSGNFTDISCKLISADYTGFSFNVYNNTQASITTKVGFLAVKVN